MVLHTKKLCLFSLYDECRIWKLAHKTLEKENIEYGSKDFVKYYCSMCIKAVYARAHIEKAKDVKVVNTL